jgi:uncharacterized membrane protein
LEYSHADRLRSAIARQNESQRLTEEAFAALEGLDLLKENERMRLENARLENAARESAARAEEAEKELRAVSENFRAELAAKRTSLLGLSRKRMEEYLRGGLERETAAVEKIEKDTMNAMDGLLSAMAILNEREREEIGGEAAALRAKAKERAAAARKRAEDAWGEIGARHERSLASAGGPVGGEALKAARRFFDWEAFLGLKIISAIGMILIILGAFAFGRYLYLRMSGAFKCLSIFGLGVLLLCAGELLNRKWRGAFSVSVSAGGAAVLFVGAALGYMTLGVLGAPAALFACAVSALIALALSMRYNAQVIALLALFGGYLPLSQMSAGSAVYGAAYFTLFNLLVLAISVKKSWALTRVFGLCAGIIADFFIVIFIAERAVSPFAASFASAALLIGLLSYIIIPVFGAKQGGGPRKTDIAVIAANLFFRFICVLGWTFRWPYILSGSGARGADYSWAAAAFFFAVCAAAGVLCRGANKPLKALFLITSAAFAALAILFRLDAAWLSTGFLIEAAALLAWGLWKNRRGFVISGAVMGGLCLIAFFAANLPRFGEPGFTAQYGALTAGAACAAAVSLKRRAQNGGLEALLQVFRGLAAFNVWLFTIFLLFTPLYGSLLLPALGREAARQFAALASVAAGLLIGFALPRIKPVYNYGFHTAAIAVSLFAEGWLVYFNKNSGALLSGGAPGAAAFAVYIAVNLLALFWARDFLRFLCAAEKLPLSWYPMALSLAGLFMAAQNITVQMRLTASSFILTALFGAAALGWVLFGFIRRSAITRAGGLAAAFICAAKLFFIDLRYLTAGRRIVSYFAAGVIFMAIAFAYQYFNKRIKEKENGTDEKI